MHIKLLNEIMAAHLRQPGFVHNAVGCEVCSSIAAATRAEEERVDKGLRWFAVLHKVAQLLAMDDSDKITEAATVLADRLADIDAAYAGHRALVRELDVAINGEAGAAAQASLCDIVAQVKRDGLVTRDSVLDAVALQFSSYQTYPITEYAAKQRVLALKGKRHG